MTRHCVVVSQICLGLKPLTAFALGMVAPLTALPFNSLSVTQTSLMLASFCVKVLRSQ